MAKNIPATKKNSPAIRTGKGKTNGPAAEYAAPHDMDGTRFAVDAIEKNPNNPEIGLKVPMPTRENWTPLNGTVSIGNNNEIKTDGQKMRGAGAAERGFMSRGPMA